MNRMKVMLVLIFCLTIASASVWSVSSNSDRKTKEAIPVSQEPQNEKSTISKDSKAIEEEDDDDDEKDGVRQRQQWFYKQRAYPNKTIPSEARLNALAHVRKMRLAKNKGVINPAVTGNAWVAVGPSSVPNGQGRQTTTAISGRVTGIAIDKNNTNRIFMATAQGGVWRTTDAGANWAPLTDFQMTLSIGSIVIDPTNSNIIYAGTGEGNSSLDSFFGSGILKSTDGGSSWQLLASTMFKGTAIASLVIDPSNTQNLYAGVTRAVAGFNGNSAPAGTIAQGVYRSTDGGTNWTSTGLSGAAQDLQIVQTNPLSLYAAINASGISRSTDNGTTWTKIAGTSPTTGFGTGFPTTGFARIGFKVSASSTQTIYASVGGTGSTDLLGVYKSVDGGQNWTQMTNPITGTTSSSTSGCFCFYTSKITVDPNNANTVLFGGVDVYRSVNGGSTWTDISTTAAANLHADVHAIEFDPSNSNVVVTGNDGGVWRSTDNGISFTNLNTSGLTLEQFEDIAIHPTDSNIVIGGLQDNGTLLRTTSNIWSRRVGGDGGFALIDPTTPTTLYSTGAIVNNPFIRRSDDSGTTFTGKDDPAFRADFTANKANFYAPIVMDAANSQTIYLGTVSLYKSINRGDNWAAVSGYPTGTSNISAIAANGTTIYIGTNNGNLQLSTDGGASFAVKKTGLPTRYITRIAIDPSNTQIAYASFSGFGSGHIFKTTNGGTLWTDISGTAGSATGLPDIPANSVVIDTSATNKLYAATDVGVFVTIDGGSNWNEVGGATLPNVSVFDIELNNTTNSLFAGTHGRGVFKLVASPVASTTTLTATPTSSVFGQSVMLSVTVTGVGGTPTGTVQFQDGATNIGSPVTLTSGSASINISNLSVATHSLTAVYSGDTNFTGSTSNTVSFTVSQASTTTTVSTSGSPSNFGTSVTFTATVAAVSPGAGTPSGTVQFMDGASNLGTPQTLSGGSATFTTSALTGGSHSISAVYSGDTNFTTSTATAITQVVNAVNSTSTLTATPTSSVFGQSVALSVTVTGAGGTPTGTVQFQDGATNIGSPVTLASGSASINVSNFSVTTHSLTAVYSGDNHFNTSTSNTVSFTVSQASTTTTVTTSGSPSNLGSAVTFTATVAPVSPGAGTPSGTVQFMDGASPLGSPVTLTSGSATFTTSALTGGSHSISAVYSGDTNFTTSTATAITQVVNAVNSTSTLTATPTSSVFGQSVMLSVTVTGSGSTPTGTVTFKDGSTTLGTSTLNGSGMATFSTSTLSVGTHSLTVIYGGDTNFTSNTSNTVSFTVSQATTTTSVVSNNNPSLFGHAVMFTATVIVNSPGAGTPTGMVAFKDGATTLGTSPLIGGTTATFSTASLSVGTHNITAMYVGDTNFATSTSTPALQQVVNQATTSIAVVSSSNPSVFEQAVTFTATVTITGGAGTPTGMVAFQDGAVTLGTSPLTGGTTATFSTATLSVATHSITAIYSGDTNFAGSTSLALSQVVNQANTSTTLVSSVNPSQNNQAVTFTATVSANSPSSGSPTGPSGTVTFFDGSTSLGTGTLSSGVATFTTSSLTPGSHSITAVYSGDGNFNGSTSATLIQSVGGTDHNSLYVADTLNNRIQRSTNDGATWQFVGNGAGTGLGQFNQPQGISTNFADTLIFVADTGNNRVQRSTNGGSSWQAIATAGTATNKVNAPQAVAYDEVNDILYIADTNNNRILKVTAASTASPSFSLMASNGVAVGQVNQPQGIAVDGFGFVYIADTLNNRVQMFNGSWSVLAAAGTTVGKVARPAGVYVNNNGVVFIADTGNNRIQTISKGAAVFMSAGTAVGTVNAPQGITFTNSGNAFIADSGNNRVQKKNFSSGVATVVGMAGTTVGKFNQPTGIR